MSFEVFLMQLQPSDIAAVYTLTEIDTEITAIKASITIARQSLRDQFSDGQANQSVQRQMLKDLYSELAIWVKARNILSDTDSSAAEFIPLDYNPSIPRI